MKTWRPIGRLLLSLALLAGAAPLRAAQSALGSQGEIYRVRTARLGDLQPSGDATRDGRAVLVLEVQRPGAQIEREIVPGTDDSDVETAPTVVLEEASGAAFVLWQTKVGNAFPILNLASRTDEGWSPAIELSGNPYAYKSTPQLLVTRDASRSADGKLGHRTVIHVVWAEEDAAGVYDTYYTAIILEDGVYIGHNTIFRVATFDHKAASPSAVPPGLLKAPRLQAGGDANSVRLVFGDADKGRITTLEVRVVPRGLVALGDGARAHIIGADKLDPKTLLALANANRAYVLDADLGLRPAIARALADEISDYILAWKPANGGPAVLADGARAHIIGVGSEFGGGLRNVTAEAPSVVEEIVASASGPAHALRFTVNASRPAPAMQDVETCALFASGDGGEATVAWAASGALVYRESDGAAWSPERQLALGPDLSLDEALRVLAERTANR